MMTMFLYDNVGNYTGSHEHIKYAPVPARYTLVAPPEGQYAVWLGNRWELRDEPVPQPAPSNDQAIATLKKKLAETDYVGLTDYDKEKPELLAQRQEWRDEIRRLEAE
jgi:hypothetical protein